MDPRELSDKHVLEAMRAGMGTVNFAVPGLGKLVIEKGRDERPFEFIQRVRREYGAWYSEQSYKADREARAIQDRRREEDNKPTYVGEALSKTVQETEASLEVILESKVAVLRERRANIVVVRERANDEAATATQAITDIDRELAKAEKFLKELKEVDEDQRKIPQEVGTDIREEVGHGEPRSSSGVDETGSPVVGGEEGEGRDPGNPGS